jgi:hypothetical protein
VSSELTLDLTPDAVAVAAASGDAPVRATSRPLGTKEATAVGECHLRIGDVVIGSGGTAESPLPDWKSWQQRRSTTAGSITH